MFKFNMINVIVSALVAKITKFFSKTPNSKRSVEKKQVVTDKLLGDLDFDVETSSWRALITTKSVKMHLMIAGENEPDSNLLNYAQEIVNSFKTFNENIITFLKRETSRFEVRYQSEIKQLFIESISLPWPNRPSDGIIYFKASKSGRLWRCDIINKSPKNLGFDN